MSPVFVSHRVQYKYIIPIMNAEGCKRQISKEQKNCDLRGERKRGFFTIHGAPLCDSVNQDQFGLATLFASQQHTLKVKLLNCDCLMSVI